MSNPTSAKTLPTAGDMAAAPTYRGAGGGTGAAPVTAASAAPANLSGCGSASSKRIRLSLACNQCRKRKVRCDTETPKCRNCWLRDEVCETTDPRYPEGGLSVRRWATKDGLMPGQNPAATHRNQARVPKHGPAMSATTAISSDQALADNTHGSNPPPSGWSASVSVSASTEASIQQRDAVSTSPATSGDGSATTAPMSWVSRGYQESINTGHGGEDNVDDAIPDLVVNTDSSSHRVKYMGGSSLQCLAIFVDIYLRRKGLQTISSLFRNGMRHVEEFPLSLTVTMPPLPDLQSLQVHLDTFFTRVWPVYPVVDRIGVEANIQYFYRLECSSPNGLQVNLTSAHIPELVSIFAIVVIAADEIAGERTPTGDTYLGAAYSLFAHLVATPYLASVQALLLLAVALRSRFKDGQSWHILAQAIRIAHSIGLHRYIRPQSSSVSPESRAGGYQVDLGLHRRVWWSCYALEKLMELETGRPSAISDEDIDQVPPLASSDAADNTPDVFVHWVGLARILSRISKQLYRTKPDSVWQLMSGIGRLDQQLLEWANSLPEGIKLGHELFDDYGVGQELYQQHISSFLSLQYYQAQITLMRASLVFPAPSFADEVKRLGSTLPSYARLLQSENICTSAARTTVRQVLELADHSIHSLILSATQPFLAAVVLALHIVKNPSKRLVRSDLELLITTTEYLEVQFRRGGQHPDFVRGFEMLRTSVSAVANMEQGPGPASLAPTLQPTAELDMIENSRELMSFPFLECQPLLTPGKTPDLTSFGMGEDISLEELWAVVGSYSLLEPTILNDPPLPAQ